MRALGGVQAQEPAAAALAVRARHAGLTAAEVERARVEERAVVRTWGPRGTLHLVAAADLGWLLDLLGPIFMRGTRRRRAELGLDEETTARGVALLRDALSAAAPLTRAEIVERLGARGLRLEGQAAPHLIGYAALAGVTCCGPDQGGKPTYVLLDAWADHGRALPREAALAELARRYLAAYGPARPEDLAAWSGLPLGEARAGWASIAGELREVATDGGPAWLPAAHAAWLDDPPASVPVVCLAPGYDPYLLGYRGRELVVAPEFARRVHPGGGLLHPTLLVDGRALGTWRSARRRDRLAVTVEPFAALPPEAQPGLAAEAADVARFLGATADLRVEPPTPVG
ncbi:MAG TPA: winged helix DNA-binding domain-containing protein [Thermomicrobiales bacterium]|nr:winged helix DNA-binding domain-containing protein [Thermomicrobiales bacterium]